MEFEYNHEKSEANLEKHGIDFEEATELWKDDYRRVIDTDSSQERRYIMIAKYRNKHWSAVYTNRNGDIRIISVRRSRKNEVEHYEQAKRHAQN